MGTEMTVAEQFKLGPAGAFAGFNNEEDSLDDGIGSSYGVINYKGKNWSLRLRGAKHNFLTKEGFPLPYLDVIILGQAPIKSKSFYAKYTPGQSDGERPICASLNGIVPDPDSAQKQSDTCALCPRNEWKVMAEGRKGRECQDYKRLAVLILPTLTQPLLGAPLLEPVFLRVPPASLNSLAVMGETYGKKYGHPYFSYVTRIQFEPSKSWPEMIFTPIQKLTDAEAPAILELRKDPVVQRIIGVNEAPQITHSVQAPSHPALSGGGAASPTPPPSTYTAPVTPPPPMAQQPQTQIIPPSTIAATTTPPPALPSTLTGLGSALPVIEVPPPPPGMVTAALPPQPALSASGMETGQSGGATPASTSTQPVGPASVMGTPAPSPGILAPQAPTPISSTMGLESLGASTQPPAAQPSQPQATAPVPSTETDPDMDAKIAAIMAERAAKQAKG